jgi:putative transposase
MLLLRVARPRVVHRDGIRFEGQRYLALTLAGYVGEAVAIRYDPRDLAEIGVYHHDRFVCRAVSPELATQTISLKDLQAARSARRRQLATQLADRREHADELLAATPYPVDRVDTLLPTAAAPRARRRLALYREE